MKSNYMGIEKPDAVEVSILRSSIQKLEQDIPRRGRSCYIVGTLLMPVTRFTPIKTLVPLSQSILPHSNLSCEVGVQHAAISLLPSH